MAVKQGDNWQSKADWMRERLKLESQRGLYAANGPVAKYLAATEPTAKREPPRISKRRGTLTFNGASTCFDHLAWKGGIVFATFQNGYQYSAPLDKDTFLEWTSESAGKFFNHVLGRDFFSE